MINNPLTPQYEIGTMLSGALGMFLVIAALLAFIFILTGGIAWITSGGDKAALEAARNRIITALIGLVLVASVWAIIDFLFPALGLSFPTISLPTLGRGVETLK